MRRRAFLAALFVAPFIRPKPAQGLSFHPDAFRLVSDPLPLPDGTFTVKYDDKLDAQRYAEQYAEILQGHTKAIADRIDADIMKMYCEKPWDPTAWNASLRPGETFAIEGRYLVNPDPQRLTVTLRDGKRYDLIATDPGLELSLWAAAFGEPK
jgi:hypothetical protein